MQKSISKTVVHAVDGKVNLSMKDLREKENKKLSRIGETRKNLRNNEEQIKFRFPDLHEQEAQVQESFY